MAQHRPFPLFGYQLDLARRLETMPTLRAAVTGMHRFGYNALVLYLEDAYAYPRHPAIGRPHAYTTAEMQEIAQLCQQQRMELIPVIPALGHCHYITSKPGYAHYDEGRGTDKGYATVSPSFPETYTLLQELFEDWCHHLPGKYLHVGLDESPSMGQWQERQTGKGSVDHARMFAEHCNRLNGICQRLGRRMIMWGDMFYYFPAAIPLVDRDIIVADWYYYSFPDTPRVEAFNFAPIDHSGELVRAGFEVWAVPSVWPNLPLGDIRDRWQNCADWIRYGRQRGLTGLFNSDWENSWGFCSLSDLLFRTFGRLATRGGTVEQVLGDTLVELTGVQAARELVPDLLTLGECHLTGHANRKPFAWGKFGVLAGAGRQPECRTNFERLAPLFSALPAVRARARRPAARNLLNAIAIAWRLSTLCWQHGAVLPELYRRLSAVAQGASDPGLLGELRELARQTRAFQADYQAQWNDERFADDPHPTARWLDSALLALDQWIADLETKPADQHRFYQQPRFEGIFTCRHPALPVARVTMAWADGTTEWYGGAMIMFASPYAVPDKTWTEYPCLPLEHATPPARILVQVNNYGQIGIGEVAIVWRGRRLVYRLERTAGRFVQMEGTTPWLGPIGATIADPTQRPDVDEAHYLPPPDADRG